VAEIHRIYLDQMFRLNVAEELRNQGYDVVRASETGHTRADDRQILEKSISEDRVLVTRGRSKCWRSERTRTGSLLQ
jgi:uncharacterized protein with PIN domain